MKYAIVTNGGKQYKVSEGTVLELDRLKAEPGAIYALDKVLLAVDGDTVQFGKPYLTDFVITAKVLDQIQGKKIRVAKFKAKARHRRVQGFRAQLTKVEVVGFGRKEIKEQKSNLKNTD